MPTGPVTSGWGVMTIPAPPPLPSSSAMPEEITGAVSFLASDDAAAIHGAVYRVDNGKGAG